MFIFSFLCIYIEQALTNPRYIEKPLLVHGRHLAFMSSVNIIDGSGWRFTG